MIDDSYDLGGAKHYDAAYSVNVFNPSFDKILSGVGEEYLDLEWPAQDGTDRMTSRTP